jgi:hypothetical protein
LFVLALILSVKFLFAYLGHCFCHVGHMMLLLYTKLAGHDIHACSQTGSCLYTTEASYERHGRFMLVAKQVEKPSD